MKTVSIFLASSIREFEKDRLDITSFVYQINRLYKNQLKINLEICEHQSNAMSIGGNQDEYNDIIRRCDYFYLLAGRRMGQYIEEEFFVAHEQFERKKQPKIYIYFEQVEAPDESLTRFRQMLWDKYDYFTPDYTNIDTIKLNIILELKRDGYIDSEVWFVDGNVNAGGEKLIDLDNIPIYARHEELARLNEELAGLDRQMNSLRDAIQSDQKNEGLKLARLTVSRKKNELTEQIHSFEMELLRLYSTIAGMGTDGLPLTRREKQARELLENGDRAGALELLRDTEWKKELERAKEKAAVARNEIIGYLKENRLRINILRTESVEKNLEEITELYEECVKLAERYGVECDVMYDYADLLYDQNSLKRAIEIGERLEKRYEMYPPDDWEQARLYNLMGMCYGKSNDHKKGEKVYRRTLEILRKLASENPSAYEPNVAVTCNNLAALLANTSHTAEAEELYREALEIYRRLASENSSVYEPDVAMTCNNLANLLDDIKEKVEAEKLYREVLEIYRRLALENPSAYAPDVATTCNNLAILLKNTNRTGEAEKLYGEALEIRRKLASENPSAYELDVAMTCNNLANLLAKTNHTVKAEKLYREALYIRRRLASDNPSVFEPYVANTCFNLGLFEWQKNNTSAALEYFSEAKTLFSKYPHLARKAEEAQRNIDRIQGQ